MNAQLASQETTADATALLQALEHATEALAACAVIDDESETFPHAAMQLLAEIGCGRAVLPASSRGGLGLGWERGQTSMLLAILRILGGAHLSAARLFEGHVNAFQLLWRHGSPAQRVALDDYVDGGGWLGVWNAPHRNGPCRLLGDPRHGSRLTGSKAYASGAGGLARALVTAEDENGTLRMLWPDVRAVRIEPATWRAQGMRASVSATVHFPELPVQPDEIFGSDDVYHLEPAFSGGAWRFLAAQLGAGEALFDLTREDLLRGGRAEDPHQRARLADAAIALQSALHWVEAAAWRAESPHHHADAIAATIAHTAMARCAVDRCLTDVLRLCQRCIGLRARLREHPMERVARDLETYLQQPAPDAARDRVAQALFEDARPLRRFGLAG